MKISVTGSGGYVGRHVVNQLRQHQHDVQEISRTRGYDILDPKSLSGLEATGKLVHLAAKTFVPDSFNDPESFYRFNFISTLNALELCRKWNAHFILLSSYLYGPPQYIPVDENHPLNPHNPYAESKKISEDLACGYARDFGIKVTILRLFNLYGPGQEGSLIIPQILESINSGEVVLKDPRPKRDYIHIDDVSSAILKVIRAEENPGNPEVFNLGTGTSHSVEELVFYMQKHSPVPFKVRFTNEYRKGEVLDSVADIKKIQDKLQWSPAISLDRGVKSLFT